MGQKFKSQKEISALASRLRASRIALNITLMELGKSTGVDYGQLSRFEAGQFRTESKNLQKVCKFLQIFPSCEDERDDQHELEMLVKKFLEFAASSPRNQQAASVLVNALEMLTSHQEK